MKYYSNRGQGATLDSSQSLDYCLELRTGLRNHAIATGDSTLLQDLNRELEEQFGFFPPDKSKSNAEEEEEVIEYDQGLEGRNLYVFIGFIVLVLVIAALLVLNILRK